MSDPLENPPRRSPLHARHESLGASFTDFGGWWMPVRYGSDLAEHHAVREYAGLFDISHMAEFVIEGPGAADHLDAVLSRPASALPVGKAAYSLLLTDGGGVIDDVIVYRLEEDWFLVIANAGNRVSAGRALHQGATGPVAVEDASDSFALLAVQGPAALDVVDATTLITDRERPVQEIPRYGVGRATVAGDEVLIARTGYTGEDGVEILVPTGAAEALWDALLEAGQTGGLVPAGLAARDTLRLEAGMPLYGHELSLDIRPAQAGLAWAAPLAPALEPDAAVLVGLVSEGRRAGRAGYSVLHEGETVGEVTSGALSPTLGIPIALAFVSPRVAAPGTEVVIDVRGTQIPATVTALPFYRRKK